MQAYYGITREELGKNARIPLKCLRDSEAVFRSLADEMADLIRRRNAQGLRSVLIVPVGPVGQYPFFVRRVNEERISLKNTWFFNMDEYMADQTRLLAPEDPLSFVGFMNREVYSRLDPELVMPASQRAFPDPLWPQRCDRLLEELGGANLCVGGIGINGHLAFNEPQSTLTPSAFTALDTRVQRISAETRCANAIGELGGALEEMPEYCVTIGFRQIMAARQIRLGVFRTWHRAVVRRAAYGAVSAAFPVTLLQQHPDAAIYVNDVAAALPTERN